MVAQPAVLCASSRAVAARDVQAKALTDADLIPELRADAIRAPLRCPATTTGTRWHEATTWTVSEGVEIRQRDMRRVDLADPADQVLNEVPRIPEPAHHPL